MPQMSLDERGNPNPHMSSSSNKRKTHSNAAEQNFDASCSVRGKPDMAVLVKRAYHNQIDLEKPATSDDVSEIVASSGFGNLANRIIGRSQQSSCCVSTDNVSLAETGLLCREPNSFRVSPGEFLRISPSVVTSSTTYSANMCLGATLLVQVV
jgi:hypothetical protein